MEWFWRWIDHFQKNAVLSALQNFSFVDGIVLIAIFWGLVQGSRKGFGDMSGKLLGILIVSMLTLSLYPIGAAQLNASIPVFSIEAAKPFVFLFLAIFLWVSMSWCINFFKIFLKVEAQGGLKTLGGMVLGGLRIVLLLSFLAQFLLLLPIKAVQQSFKPGHTFTGYAISRIVPDLRHLPAKLFHKPVLKQSAEARHKIVG